MFLDLFLRFQEIFWFGFVFCLGSQCCHALISALVCLLEKLRGR